MTRIGAGSTAVAEAHLFWRATDRIFEGGPGAIPHGDTAPVATHAWAFFHVSESRQPKHNWHWQTKCRSSHRWRPKSATKPAPGW